MGSFRSSKAARRSLTVVVLLTVLVTTFLPGWDSPAQAASAARTAATVPVGSLASSSPGRAASGSASVSPPASQVPLNALVLSEPGKTEALAAAIVSKGGTLYVHEGNALFVGLDELNYTDLAPLGAQAVYHSAVPPSELTRLSSIDHDAAATWNAIAAAQPSSRVTTAAGVSSGVYYSAAGPSANPALGLYEPDETQTSLFLAGDVAVKVLFVESNAGSESWNESEVAKVKTEVVQALDWWTTTAAAPRFPGDPPRPSANLTWDVSYVSPFDGTDPDKAHIRVDVEPIEHTILDGMGDGGWMSRIAAQFAGIDPNLAVEEDIRQLADDARTGVGDDWGLVLYVVDSSADTDGKFADGNAAGAALNGPWAVVSYDGGTLGVDSLEILIAKMIGHVFGAGDESWDPAFPTEGCRNTERYGYLRMSHDNCEYDNHTPDSSLMLSGQKMIDAYQGHQLSDSARAQVGWRDSDGNGIYDVLDTLSDTFTGFTSPAICPILHLLEIPINNIPTVPDEFGSGEDETHWAGLVWDPATGTLKPQPSFTPVNINRPGFVWGRVNEGEWVAGDPTDGAWDSLDEEYNLLLPGTAGELNRVEIAIMNRWEQQAYQTTNPVSINVLDPPELGGPYESEDTDTTQLYLTGTTGWTMWEDPSYSLGSTRVSVGTGAEACFAFNGTEVSILHSMVTDGTANVYVDGELHSTISYTDLGLVKQAHTIADLPPGNHTVGLVAVSGVVDFDAWQITDTLTNPSAGQLIDASSDPGISGDGFHFYEALNTAEDKIQYVGEWDALDPLLAPGRPGTPDNKGVRGTRAYDRVYVFFTHADTVGIYRGVFPGGGSANVYVDGSLRGTMYNHAKVAGVAPFYIGGLDPLATHTVEISINPNTNPDAQRFDLDALRFLDLTDNGPDFSLYVATPLDVSLDVAYNGAQESNGNWKPYSSGHYIQTNEDGALQTVFFQGSAVAVQVATGSGNGLLEIYVDGQLMRTVDNKAPVSKDMPIVAHGFDPNRPHVLQVRQINANPAKPKLNKVFGYTVYSVPPVEPGSYEEYEYGSDGKPTRSDFIYEQKWTLSKLITSASAPSGGHYIQSAHEDARAYLYFTGADSLTIYGASGSYGATDIYINGVLKGTFIEKGKKGYNNPYTVTGLDPGVTNCLELRVSMAKGMPKKISLDRVELYNKPVLTPDTLEVGGTDPGDFENDAMIDIGGGQTAPALQFSGQWNRVANANASGSSYDMVGSIDDEVVFDVRNATSVVLYRRLYSKYGEAEVYVDGKLRYTFDNYVASPTSGVFKQQYVIAGLDPGFDHHIRIVPQRTGKKANKYKPFDVDYIEVRSGDQSSINYLENGYYEDDDAAALAGDAISYVGSGWDSSADVSTAKIKGNKAVVAFYGNAFSVYFNKDRTGGKADIYIDGILQGTYNLHSGSAIADVPFSVAGFEEGMHVAEVVVKSGKLTIDAYQAYTVEPNVGPATYALAPATDSHLILSGQWTVSGSYLTTKEQYASVSLFVTGGDTLQLTHQKITVGTGDIQVYVDGKLHSTLDVSTIKSVTGPEGTYVVTGLNGMLTRGYWIEISNPKAKTISIRQLRVDRVENIEAPLTDSVGTVEAEGDEHVIASGYWWQRPAKADARYNEGFYEEGRNKFVHYYIPTQNVNYLTIYRPVGPFGNADVYLDGEFWGTMPNTSATIQGSVPFSVGPIPNPSDVHVVELRPSTGKKFGLDYFVGVGMQTIEPGYYENDDVAFVGGDDASGKHYDPAYTGKWYEITDLKASGGTLYESRKRGDRLSAVFEGNEIIIYRRTLSSGNYMTAYVDGIAYPIYNKSKLITNRVAHTILLPNDGPHSLELYNDSGRFDFDAIEIKTAVPATKGAYQHDSAYVAVNGTWDTVISDDHSDGSYVSTKVKYSSAFFLFSGDRVTTYLTRGKNWGIVNVYLDGTLVDRVDLYLYDKVLHPTDEPFFEYDLANLEGGTHVLELRFEGKKGKKGLPVANFDAFTVNGYPVPRPGDHMLPSEGAGGGGGEVTLPEVGCYEENSFWWKFVGPSDFSWFGQSSVQASGGQYRRGRSNNAGDVYAEFSFKGTSFGFVYHKRSQGGIAEVYIDTDWEADLDMYSPTDTWITTNPYAVLYVVNDLDYGNHTVRIVFKHAKNPSSGGYDIYVDRIDLPAYSTDVTCIPSIAPPGP